MYVYIYRYIYIVIHSFFWSDAIYHKKQQTCVWPLCGDLIYISLSTEFVSDCYQTSKAKGKMSCSSCL